VPSAACMFFARVGKHGRRDVSLNSPLLSPHRPTGNLTSLGFSMAAAPPSPGRLRTITQMCTQEVWVARQLDKLAARGPASLAAALKIPSLVCSTWRATRATTSKAASEVTDPTGGSPSSAVPGSDIVAAGKAHEFEGPTITD
jgi:hypothetical protein